MQLFFLKYECKIIINHSSFLSLLTFYVAFLNVSRYFSWWCKMTSLLKIRVLTSLITSRVSCLGPWARQNIPALLKIEQTLSRG